MWSTITVVTSGRTLAAFLIAAVAASLRAWLRHRERQLIAAPLSARDALVQALNNSFLITARPLSTTKLSADQAYDLLLAQLRARSDRFKLTSIVIVVLALIAASVTIFSLAQPVPHTLPASVVPVPTTASSTTRTEVPRTELPLPSNVTAGTTTAPGSSTRDEATPPAPERLDGPEVSTTESRITSATRDPIVTLNHRSHIYHCPTCSRARACTANCTDTTPSDALSRGARACRICNGTCN